MKLNKKMELVCEINSYLSDAWQFQINNCVQDYILYVTKVFSLIIDIKFIRILQ